MHDSDTCNTTEKDQSGDVTDEMIGVHVYCWLSASSLSGYVCTTEGADPGKQATVRRSLKCF